jgi:hypothetical protein
MSDIDPFFRGYRPASEQPADKRFLTLDRTPQRPADLEAIARRLEIDADRLADLFGLPQGE